MSDVRKNRYGDLYQFEKLSENQYMISGGLKYWRYGGKEGQSVPVGVGMPTIKMAGLTVGGTA